MLPPRSLPNSHHRTILLGKADCMNFHRSGPAVISKLKALLLPQGLTSQFNAHRFPPRGQTKAWLT